jgi:Protein of unknown function (DUF2510)
VNPGWYADPHGGPDLRWWDGSSWTEHTSPPVAAASTSTPDPAAASGASGEQWAAPAAAPTAAPPATSSDQWAPPVGQAPVGVPPGTGSGAFPPPQQGGGSNRTLLTVLGVGIALLLVVGGVALVSGGDDEASPDPTSTTTTTDESTTTTEPDETTTTTVAVDPDTVTSGAVSYTRLPAPWDDWVSTGHADIYELANTAGQFVVVQEQAPSGGQWVSNLLVGDLGPSIDYSGAADLPAATQALTDELVASYYVAGAVATPILNTAVEIDGHPAHFIHTELSFEQAGLDTTAEKVVVVVIDTGESRPSVFWASIPANRSDLNAGMDEVYRSLRVDD